MNKALILTGLIAAAGLLTGLTATSRAAYETAPYTVLQKEGPVEIRDYPALTTVSATAPVDADRDGRFMKLFGYISGKNEKQEKIEMTTPVFMDQAGGQSKMSFAVPAKVAAAGAPGSGAEDITLGTRPPGRFAVLRFNGLQRKANEEQALAELRKWLASQKLTPTGEPVFAYYDSPWTPGPMRRNEVMLPLPLPAGKK
ncbi:MAG: heme-binding protein [Verrucomicrobiota bacterium]